MDKSNGLVFLLFNFNSLVSVRLVLWGWRWLVWVGLYKNCSSNAYQYCGHKEFWSLLLCHMRQTYFPVGVVSWIWAVHLCTGLHPLCFHCLVVHTIPTNTSTTKTFKTIKGQDIYQKENYKFERSESLSVDPRMGKSIWNILILVLKSNKSVVRFKTASCCIKRKMSIIHSRGRSMTGLGYFYTRKTYLYFL